MTRVQFISLTEATQKALRRFLVALCCGDSRLADDIAQEAFLKGYMAMDTVKNTASFKPWIYRIAYNTFINYSKTRRHYDSADTLPDIADEEPADFYGIDNDQLYAALNRLPDKERTAILLYYMEDYPVKEIARFLNASSEAVRQNLSRGRKHLKAILTSSQH